MDADTAADDALEVLLALAGWLSIVAGDLSATAGQLAAYAQRRATVGWYALGNWYHRRSGPLASELWALLQVASRGRWVHMLTGRRSQPVEEEWELIEVNSRRRQPLLVNIYEPDEVEGLISEEELSDEPM
jgi:hypothetical protein